MHVILGTESKIDAWLNDFSRLTFETVSQPYEKSDLVWYPVASAMGRTQFDEPESIKGIGSHVYFLISLDRLTKLKNLLSLSNAWNKEI